MNLVDTLLNIIQFSDEDIIFVEEPWTLQAQVKIISIDETEQTKIYINGRIYIFQRYSLFEDFEEQNMTFQEKCERILEYAINDA